MLFTFDLWLYLESWEKTNNKTNKEHHKNRRKQIYSKTDSKSNWDTSITVKENKIRRWDFPARCLACDFPGGSVVKNPPAKQETWVWSWVGKIPWRRKWQPPPVFLPGNSYGQRSLAGHRPWGGKRAGPESATEQLLHYRLIFYSLSHHASPISKKIHSTSDVET